MLVMAKNSAWAAWPADALLSEPPKEGTTVNKVHLNLIALAVGVAFSAGAMAQNMSKNDYQDAKTRIGTEYKSARTACASLSGNRNDICLAEAKGTEKVALADLEAGYRPTAQTRHEAGVARAEADLAVAKERCDDMAGNAKDVCVKEATAAATIAKADARSRMKTSDANATAREKTADARKEANEKAAVARRDANAEKLEAQYKVAKERCDEYAGGAKDYCLQQAKARFGTS